VLELCRPAAFPFFYIEPWKKEYLPITAKFLGPITRVEAEQIAPIGEAWLGNRVARLTKPTCSCVAVSALAGQRSSLAHSKRACTALHVHMQHCLGRDEAHGTANSATLMRTRRACLLHPCPRASRLLLASLRWLCPAGNAPTLMSMADMRRVMPVWFNVSIAVHNDPDSSKEWGWVQEMYAFTLSCTKVGIKKIDIYRDVSRMGEEMCAF
jgi:hypothetical protein